MVEKIYREIKDKMWEEVGEVVRCKDCIYWGLWEPMECSITLFPTLDDDYCSYGERGSE